MLRALTVTERFGLLRWFLLVIRQCGFCFESQKLRFYFEAAGKAGQRSVRANDTMTRHDDRQGILAVGGANRADGLGRAEGRGQMQITYGLTERDFSQGAPNFFLELAPI